MKILKWFWLHKKISIVLLIALVGFIYWQFFKNGKVDYTEAKVERGLVEEELILSGSVIADEYAKLTFPASGTLSFVGVSEGDQVYRGQLLAKIDTLALNSALQRARADLRAAEANVDQVHDDLKDNDEDETFTQKNTRTAAEVSKDKAYEAVLIAEDNLKKAAIYAPFKGLVTYIANPFSGVNIVAATTQIEVINPDTIHFEVSADQTEVRDIKVGDEVRIILDADEEKKITGKVNYVSYATKQDEIGAIYEVKIEFTNLENNGFVYRVGMTGDAHFVLKRKENTLFVPREFIKSDKDGEYVLINNGKDKKYIELGLEGEERTEIVSGIEEGAIVYND